MAWRSSPFCRRAAAESAPNALPNVTRLRTASAVRPFMMCLLCRVFRPLVIIQLLAYQVLRLVVLADVLHQLLLRCQIESYVYVKRFDKGPRILESYRQIDMAEIHAPVALGHVQHFSVRYRASTNTA